MNYEDWLQQIYERHTKLEHDVIRFTSTSALVRSIFANRLLTVSADEGIASMITSLMFEFNVPKNRWCRLLLLDTIRLHNQN